MSLQGQKILFFVADNYEDLELQVPKYRLLEEKCQVVIAGKKGKECYRGKHGYPCVADISFDDVNVSNFQGLVIPGGYAPDKLRMVPKVLEITRQFHEEQKLIAFICHAGWIPISSQILKGVKCTSYQAIKDDIINAGANYIDAPCVKDRHFISSRSPADLPEFCPAIVEYLKDKAEIKCV